MYNHGYGGGYYEGDYEDYAYPYPGYHGYEYEYGGPSRGHGGGGGRGGDLVFVANSKMKQIAILMITKHAAGMIVVAATAINTWII